MELLLDNFFKDQMIITMSNLLEAMLARSLLKLRRDKFSHGTSLVFQNPVLHQANRQVTVQSISQQRTFSGFSGNKSNNSNVAFTKQSPQATTPPPPPPPLSSDSNSNPFSEFVDSPPSTTTNSSASNSNNNNNNNNNLNKNNNNNNNNNNKQQQSKQQSPMFAVFKPNSDESRGSALQFKYSGTVKCVFIEAARQSGPKLPPGATGNQFDWQNLLAIKLSVTELGKLLTVLTNVQKDVDLIHQSTKQGSKVMTTLKFSKQENHPSYSVRIGKKVEGDSTTSSVSIYLDQAEAAVLSEFIRTSIRSALGFTHQ